MDPPLSRKNEDFVSSTSTVRVYRHGSAMEVIHGVDRVSGGDPEDATPRCLLCMEREPVDSVGNGADVGLNPSSQAQRREKYLRIFRRASIIILWTGAVKFTIGRHREGVEDKYVRRPESDRRHARLQCGADAENDL
jgi:hypothetical protein